MLEDDDIEFDDGLFKKLLQQDLQLEPDSELPPQQLPVESTDGVAHVSNIAETSVLSAAVKIEKQCAKFCTEESVVQLDRLDENRRKSAPTRNTKEKKKVCFKNGSKMVQICVIPVARGSCLLPVANKKDAPIPRKVVSQQLQQKDPDLADVLYTVLCQDSKWMTVSHNCVHIIRIRLKYGHSTLPLYLFPLNSFSMVQYTYVVLKVLFQLDVIQLP